MGNDIPVPSRHGQVVRKCTVPGTVAFTFNDGPSFYTDFILNQFALHGAHATFFLSMSQRLEDETQSKYWESLVRKIYDSGHLVGLHATSQDLSDDGLLKATQKLSAILSTTPQKDLQPRYVRTSPETCTVDNGCVERLTVNGGRLVFRGLDSNDLHHNSTEDFHSVTSALLFDSLIRANPSKDSFLIQMHDTEEQTALNIGYLLQKFSEKGFKATTVGDCVADIEEHWYQRPDDVISFTRNRPVKIPGIQVPAQPWWVAFLGVGLLEIAALSCLFWAARRYKKIKSHLKVVQ